MTWWVNLGYPAFEEGDDGFPDVRNVVMYYYQKKVNDKKGDLMFNREQILWDTKIRNIEHRMRADLEKIVMETMSGEATVSADRRRFLSHLLNIPPVLLGLVTLGEGKKMVGEQRSLTRVKPVDIDEYSATLQTYWLDNYCTSSYEKMPDVLHRISVLYESQANGKERQEIRKLLSSYHLFAGLLLRDHCFYYDAIKHLNRAFSVAKISEDIEQQALVLYARGFTWRMYQHIDEASQDYDEAMQYEKKLPDYLNAATKLHAGLIKSNTQMDKGGAGGILRLMESGGKIIQANQGNDNPYVINSSLARYHRNIAEVLVSVGRPEEAIKELRQISGNRGLRARMSEDAIIGSSYVKMQEYEEAMKYLERAEMTGRVIGSTPQLMRLREIFGDIKDQVGHSEAVSRYDFFGSAEKKLREMGYGVAELFYNKSDDMLAYLNRFPKW